MDDFTVRITICSQYINNLLNKNLLFQKYVRKVPFALSLVKHFVMSSLTCERNITLDFYIPFIAISCFDCSKWRKYGFTQICSWKKGRVTFLDNYKYSLKWHQNSTICIFLKISHNTGSKTLSVNFSYSVTL